MPAVFFTLALAFSVVIEIALVNYGCFLPLLGICVFYFTMRYGVDRTLPWHLLAGALLDAVWMHRFPSQIISVLLISGLANVWRPYGDLGSWLSLAVVGLCIGLLQFAVHFLGVLATSLPVFSWRSLVRPLCQLVPSAILITPLISLLFNRLLQQRVTWLSTNDEEWDD